MQKNEFGTDPSPSLKAMGRVPPSLQTVGRFPLLHSFVQELGLHLGGAFDEVLGGLLVP